ncbi:uncharacterized protein LOC131007832 [Salvia miltiorrhiza]|uniref:uncharacterized protein LOC131007832 n=1 Tax=Salvia miltiorrhiza TaxID=226208 RepID=UPI0025ACCBF5|nr:uncharacterized protein LOC131007832 [Salvia miltiorrhiza]
MGNSKVSMMVEALCQSGREPCSGHRPYDWPSPSCLSDHPDELLVGVLHRRRDLVQQRDLKSSFSERRVEKLRSIVFVGSLEALFHYSNEKVEKLVGGVDGSARWRKRWHIGGMIMSGVGWWWRWCWCGAKPYSLAFSFLIKLNLSLSHHLPNLHSTLTVPSSFQNNFQIQKEKQDFTNKITNIKFHGHTVDPQRLVDMEQQLQDALAEIARQKEEMRQKEEQTDARFEAQQRMLDQILARLPPGSTGPTPPTGASS